jgi:YidC/Oxa1 family membrane protein insertase
LREQGEDKYQADFVTEAITIPNNEQISFPSKVFSGAKELKLLDYYGAKGFTSNDKTYQLKQFDKTVDFGIFYFLTKPIFLLITFLNSFLHNFGFAIILLTIIIKLILSPIAAKSYLSMGKMKALAPKIAQVKKEIGGNKLELNRRIMEIYKENKVNPLSGCLPLFLQIPVFFALYKVLYISIEMRGADFIFWIKDLSMKDPTSIFNLFGLLPFSVPSFLQIGVLPIVMGLTTYLQQSLSPKSGDEMQMMIIKSMPFILIFVFASFPAGIVLYWITNNILSILQQLYVEKVMLPKALAKNNKVSKIIKK